MKSGCEYFDQSFQDVTLRATKFKQESHANCVNSQCPLILKCAPMSGGEIQRELGAAELMDMNPVWTALRSLSLRLTYKLVIEKNEEIANTQHPCNIDLGKYQNSKFLNLLLPFINRIFLDKP